jgi:putative membrane protein
LTAFVALEHVYFMILEMVLWKSQGPKVFKITTKFAGQTAGLASNQGLYNGFLLAALVLGLFLTDPVLAHAFRFYGLTCVVVAGVWGGITVHPRIFLFQGLPALMVLVMTVIG